jgi:hypothetical protein
VHRHLVAWLLLVALLAPAGGARAREPNRGQGPLEVISYIVYPVGVVIDTVLFAPIRYLATFGVVRTAFGLGKLRPAATRPGMPPEVEGNEGEPRPEGEQEDPSASAV